MPVMPDRPVQPRSYFPAKTRLSQSQVRQRPMLAVYAVVLLLIVALIGGIALTWLSSHNSNHLMIIGNFLTLGTLLLALVAGIIALAAYTAATGLPNLMLQLKVPLGEPNELLLPREDNPGHLSHTAGPGAASIARIIVANTTRYAARSPAVIIEFKDAQIWEAQYAEVPGWVVTARDSSRNVKEIQWDGGPNYAIHGNSSRHLPDLNLAGLHYDPADNVRPKMVIRLLADGYSRQEITLPIGFAGSPLAAPPRQWR